MFFFFHVWWFVACLRFVVFVFCFFLGIVFIWSAETLWPGHIIVRYWIIRSPQEMHVYFPKAANLHRVLLFWSISSFHTFSHSFLIIQAVHELLWVAAGHFWGADRVETFLELTCPWCSLFTDLPFSSSSCSSSVEIFFLVPGFPPKP